MEGSEELDADQKLKLQAICDLLVAAGYFRARISGLTAFDKVVGGMTWCIQNCSVDIDVDLFYQENASIGRKIGLTERIVSVLPEMKCPSNLEPHQIQGLDFPKIFPVIQWLVKKALETRAEREERNKNYAIRQYKVLHNIEEPKNSVIQQLFESSRKIDSPKRMLQQINDNKDKTDSARLQLTLLEFSEVLGPGLGTEHIKEKKMTDELRNNVAKKKINQEVLSNLFSIGRDKLEKATEEYNQLKKERHQKEMFNSVEELENRIMIVKEGIQKIELRVSEMQIEKEKLKNNLVRVEARVKEKEEKLRINTDIISAAKENKLIEKMKKMVDLKEKIRSAETKFREKCKDDLQLMRERNEAVRTEMRSLDGVQGTRENDEDRRKIENLKEVYLKLSQENYKLERLIDSSPSKPELSQYQKRFIELNNQISTKHAETQNFYDMFNNLTLQKFFIEKEIKLLTSIQDNLSECSGTQSAKYAFIRSIEELVSGVKEAKKKAEEKLEDQMKITAVARKEGERLREEREEYYSLLHEIQQELKKE